MKRMTFELVKDFLHDRVAPVAAALDHDPGVLRRVFEELGQHHWLGLKIGRDWGGAEVSVTEFGQFQELVTRYSGAAAFLQAQHQTAGVLIGRSDNEQLKRAYLPRMSTGEAAIGVGFSHLRRSGEPVLKALPVAGGYELNGSIPWITGWGIFQSFVGGATLPDDRALYGLLPFTDTQSNSGGISFSAPMPLTAISSTNTVSAELQHFFLPEAQVLFVAPAHALHQNDRQNVLRHSFFALGCAQAGLDVVERAGQERSLTFIHSTYRALEQELQDCREAIYGAEGQPFEARLQSRVWAIELAVRCAHVAVVVSAGAANSLHHPSGRIYREALVFSVSGQTAAVMAATLEHLVRHNPGSSSGI